MGNTDNTDAVGGFNPVPRVSMGVEGLNFVLGGGVTPERLYLLEGTPGTGKTTFALQFLLAGIAVGERSLYITLSETEAELRAVSDSHRWSLDGLVIHELVDEVSSTFDAEQSILHPAELELGETIKNVMMVIERVNPTRVVFDSLSEMRLLAQDPLRYRRQILALKQFFSRRQCTVLLLDDKTSDPGDLQLHSIAHGVISLEQSAQAYGVERRRLRVIKMRGIKFQGGYHDFVIDTGRVAVFPRLVAAQHFRDFNPKPVTSGNELLDLMMGGGLVPGTNTLLLGPAGVGKTSSAVACMTAALRRGEKAVYYLFDEGLATMVARSEALGFKLMPFVESGQLRLEQIDPAAMSPGEFADSVLRSVHEDKVSFVGIDSLNAYLQAMPAQSFLLLHMHELLTFLNQQGVTTVLVLGQHGMMGAIRTDIDLSYLSDAIVMFRLFEAKGQVRSAISVIKSRAARNERTVREFRLSSEHGLEIGEPLVDFEGVLSGLPSYRGDSSLLENGSRR